MDPGVARQRVAQLDWWHTIEVAPGVLTPGGWDLRTTAERLPWPPSLAGMRCLDVGTMDGFWAFELERRGAREVWAVDVLDAARLDHPVADRLSQSCFRRSSEENFAVAAELLGSHATLHDLNVYDLDPAEVGQFDLVVMGYVLQMLRDPLRGLEAVRRVCRGSLIVLDTVSRPLDLLPTPLARLDARRDGSEWFVFNRRGLGEGPRAGRLDHAGSHSNAQGPARARDHTRRAHVTTPRHPRPGPPRPKRGDPGHTHEKATPAGQRGDLVGLVLVDDGCGVVHGRGLQVVRRPPVLTTGCQDRGEDSMPFGGRVMGMGPRPMRLPASLQGILRSRLGCGHIGRGLGLSSDQAGHPLGEGISAGSTACLPRSDAASPRSDARGSIAPLGDGRYAIRLPCGSRPAGS